MKKNKLLICALVLNAMFSFNVKASAQTEYDHKIKLETTIDKWSWANDLVYHKVDDRDNDWFTKSVYLRGSINHLYTNVNLGENDNIDTTIALGSTRASDGSWDTSKGAVINYGFDEGSIVTLVEEYTFKNIQDIAGKIKYLIDTKDYLSFSFEDDYEGNELDSFLQSVYFGYTQLQGNSSSDHLDVYIDCVYNTEDVTSENRHLVCSVSTKENEKVFNITKGSMVLPTYSLFTDLSVSGNAIPSGNFVINASSTDISNGTRNAVMYASSLKNGTNWSFVENSKLVNSTIGSTNDEVLSNTTYALLTFNEFKEFYQNTIVEYYPEGATTSFRSVDSMTSEDGTVTNSPSLDDDVTSTGNSYGASSYTQTKDFLNDLTKVGYYGADYYLTLTYNDKSNLPIPTGIFYDIIPYIIIALLSAIGIVVIKKNKIKDESNN